MLKMGEHNIHHDSHHDSPHIIIKWPETGLKHLDITPADEERSELQGMEDIRGKRVKALDFIASWSSSIFKFFKERPLTIWFKIICIWISKQHSNKSQEVLKLSNLIQKIQKHSTNSWSIQNLGPLSGSSRLVTTRSSTMNLKDSSTIPVELFREGPLLSWTLRKGMFQIYLIEQTWTKYLHNSDVYII